jgi:murein peptide amidase A
VSIRTFTIGSSVERRSIRAIRTGPGDLPPPLVIAGIHGDEPKSVFVALHLVSLLSDPAQPLVPCVIVTNLNPDGYQRRRRTNANGVDLNRNFPTRDWAPTRKRSRYYSGSTPLSEPESRAIARLIDQLNPPLIITIHSINRQRHCVNYDGPARSPADAMAKRNGYPVRESIGYPTPGSFGTWAGVESQIATITLELPSHHSPQRCWRDNESALIHALTETSFPGKRKSG